MSVLDLTLYWGWKINSWKIVEYVYSTSSVDTRDKKQLMMDYSNYPEKELNAALKVLEMEDYVCPIPDQPYQIILGIPIFSIKNDHLIPDFTNELFVSKYVLATELLDSELGFLLEESLPVIWSVLETDIPDIKISIGWAGREFHPFLVVDTQTTLTTLSIRDINRAHLKAGDLADSQIIIE